MRNLSILLVLSAMLLAGCGMISLPAANTATPFIITATLPPTPSPAPSDTPAPPTAVPTAVPVDGLTTTQVNVRDRPSTDGTLLGMVAAAVKVQVIGQDSSSNWYEIIYKESPNGVGWVSSQYINVQNKDKIPTVSGPAGSTAPEDKRGTPVAQASRQASTASSQGSAAATVAQPAVPAATISPALADGDSAASPAVKVSLSMSSTRAAIYSSDVSSPQGDSEDWIGFTSDAGSLMASLACGGNGTLKVGLEKNGVALQQLGGLACGKTETLSVDSGQAYLIHISLASASQNLQYVDYSLRIEIIG